MIASVLITAVSIWLTRRIGLTDSPSSRKQHMGDIPLAGGSAIFMTVLYGIGVHGMSAQAIPLLAVCSTVYLIGLYDDYKGINPSLRLTIYFGAGAALATNAGIIIVQVGDLLSFGPIELLKLSIPLTALAVAGLCNAYNMIDGVDGLSASMAGLPLVALYALGQIEGSGHTSAYIGLVLLPLAIFLCLNLGPNTRWLPKIFLGDSGSVTLGLMIAVVLIAYTQDNNALIRPVTALWMVTVPLMDMLATMLRRAKGRRPLMEADRSHLHHALLDLGLSSRQSLLALVGYASACIMVGLSLETLPEYVSMMAYLLLFACHCLFVTRVDSIITRQ